MAEFTEFMNKRVDHFFQMFKELRSGSITYPEIAKRENVRPPINKVCQKLGVKKVAQMTSDEALLQAIMSVVYDIEMKRRARLGEGADYTEGGLTDMNDDLIDGEGPNSSTNTPRDHASPPGLDHKSTPSTSNTPSSQVPPLLMDPSKSRKNVKAQQTKDRLAAGLSSNSTSPMTTYREDGSQPNSARSAPLTDPAEILKLALSVRAFNGRIQKALQQAQQRPGASAELLNLTGGDVQNLVKSLCTIIGCKRLDCTVSHDATTQAVEKYAQSVHNLQAHHHHFSPADVKHAFSTDTADPSVVGSSPSLGGSATYFRVSPDERASGLQIETPALPSPSMFGPSFSPVAGAHNGLYPPFAPQDSAAQRGDVNSNVSPAHSTPHSAHMRSPVARPKLTLDEVYQEFWELSYKLFLYVCNPYRHCHECLCVVEDLVSLLENCAELRSPLTALALDSVIQRAMYELSDKVSRPLDAATVQAITNMGASVTNSTANSANQSPRTETPRIASDSATSNTADANTITTTTADTATNNTNSPLPPLPPITPPDCSVRNIEMCIALMSRNVSPICAKIREDYYAAHRLPSPQLGSNWCDKVLTLTRQLQELIAWSSPHCQARVPAYVPSRRYSFAPNATKDMLFTDRSLTEGANTSNTVPSEPKVIDFISALSPNTATEIVTALKLKDATLCEVLRQIGSGGMHAKMPHDLESSIQLNLHKVIHQSISGDCSIVLCGATVLGLSDAQSKIKLDFAALAAPYHTNTHDLSVEEQRADLARYYEVQEQMRELERAVEGDKLTEIAWKHLKACARDFHTQSQDYIIKLTSSAENQGQGRNFNHGGHNNGYDYQNHHTQHHSNSNSNNYHNKYVLQPPQYGERAYTNPQYPGGAGTSPTAGSLPPELILEIAEDAECIRKIGDALVEKYFAQRMERTASAPIINQILRKVEEIQESQEKAERERVNFVRKFSKSLDRVLKDNRYLYVRMVSNKARFTHINFEHQVAPHLQVSVNVIGCNPLPVQMTELVSDYINLDGTGKVRDFLQTVKLFASSHHISDPASGYLSSTAWYVMALHVLLKNGLLPNLHHNRLFGAFKPTTPQSNNSNSSTPNHPTNTNHTNNSTTTTTTTITNTQPLSARTTTPRAPYTPRELPNEYRERLQGTSLLVLLDLFFRYYVEQVNLFTSVVTLREQGALLPKVEWPANPVLWRLSIEDPFEALGSPKPYDLGSTLSRPGQLTTFKALRRAVYGIHSIMADTSNDCHENISRLFSRVELINLARRSDYMGAVITASPAWVRPAEPSVLDSPQYTTHSRALHKKYDPESLQVLFPTVVSSPREGDFGGSPPNSGRKAGVGGPGVLAKPLTSGGNGSLSAKATEFQPSWLSAPGAGSGSAHSSVHGSAPNSARSALTHTSSPPGAGPHYKAQGPGQYNQPYGQGPSQGQSGAQGGYAFNNGKAAVPHLSQLSQGQGQGHGQYHNAPHQGFDPRTRPGQYREELPQPPHQQQQGYHQNQTQGQGQGQRGAYLGGTVNLNNRQAVPNFPPQQGADPRYARGAGPQGQGEGGYGQQQQGHQSQGQQGGRPFDPTAAALAASAERRYPVNQLAPSQGFDLKARKGPEMQQHQPRHEKYGVQSAHPGPQQHQHQQHQPMHQQQGFPGHAPRGDAPRYAVLEERYAKPDNMYPGDDRYHSGNLAPRGQEGPRYGAYGAAPGNQTARESSRYPAEELPTSGSMSARYASLEDRYGSGSGAGNGAYGQPQSQQQQMQQRHEAEPASRQQQQQPAGLPQGFKLDLQPRFAEDRYSYAQDSARSVSATSSAYPSARGPDERSSAYAGTSSNNVPGPVNIGNLSARRMNELNAMTSPRMGYTQENTNSTHNNPAPQQLSLSMQALAQVNEHQKQKKSPLVPLIPLEGLSNFSGSGNSSEYSNPLYSDRSSHYISTGRSDGLGDTGRSTLVASNTNAYYGPPGSGRSTATHHNQHQQHMPQQHLPPQQQQYGMGYGHLGSAPNTTRSVEFSLGASLDSNDDYRQGYFGPGLGGISLTARSLEDTLLTDRNTHSAHSTHSSHGSSEHVNESMLTNRLDYMGLEDLSTSGSGGVLPLSAVRPPQPPLLALPQKQGGGQGGDFDEMLHRLNQSSLSHSQHSQSISMSQSSGGGGGGRASFIADLPLNSARSAHSGNSGRASNASLVIPQEMLDFGLHYNSTAGSNDGQLSARGAPSRRESLQSELGRAPEHSLHALSGSAHSLYPVPQRAPSITGGNALDLQGLLGFGTGEGEMYAKSGGTSGGMSGGAPGLTSGGGGVGASAEGQKSSYLQMLFNDTTPLDQE